MSVEFDIVRGNALQWRPLWTKAVFLLALALISSPAPADAETGEAPVTPANWTVSVTGNSDFDGGPSRHGA
jgi:hypothetical protein